MSKKIRASALKYARSSTLRSVWREIRLAMAGTEQDFTNIKLGKAIFLLSLPMVLEMVMESIFAVVDIFFVSRLGAEAVATIGITESLMTIIYALGFGLSMGTTALVSRRIGEKNPEEASSVAVQAILAGVIISMIIAVPGMIYASDLLRLMGASHSISNGLSIYTAIILGGNVVIMLLFVINAVFRSAGDAALSMRVLWIANMLNIVLDPLLIFGWGPIPAMGIMGAAIATTIGRGVAVIYQFYLLFRGSKRIHITSSVIRFDFTVMKKLIRLSIGGIGQNIIATSSWIGLVRIIAEFGSIVLAGYTIAIRIVIFSLLPSWGLANAAATLVGQNLGANRPDRSERSVKITSSINMILLSLVGLLFVLYPSFFVSLLTPDPEVVRAGAISLRIISIGFLAYGPGMVLIQAFNGAGDTYTPTLINFICFWIIEIPLAYLLALSLRMNEEGVYYAILFSESLLAGIVFLLFRRGRWKLKMV